MSYSMVYAGARGRQSGPARRRGARLPCGRGRAVRGWARSGHPSPSGCPDRRTWSLRSAPWHCTVTFRTVRSPDSGVDRLCGETLQGEGARDVVGLPGRVHAGRRTASCPRPPRTSVPGSIPRPRCSPWRWCAGCPWSRVSTCNSSSMGSDFSCRPSAFTSASISSRRGSSVASVACAAAAPSEALEFRVAGHLLPTAAASSDGGGWNGLVSGSIVTK